MEVFGLDLKKRLGGETMIHLTYHGHSCVEIAYDEHRLIIDPFLSGNPVAKAKPEDIKVNYVLVTHGHNDHIGDALQIAKANDATIITTYELAMYFQSLGANVHPMGIGGSFRFPFGRVKFTLAFHGAGELLEGSNELRFLGLPAGILLTLGDKTIYHAGDTGLFGDMKLIGELNQIDLAFLPIGDNFTMGPDDALLAAQFLRAKEVIPIHYNTFPVIVQDDAAFVDSLREKGIEGHALAPGATYTIG